MKFNSKLYPWLLVLIGIATHLIWFSPSSTLFHDDWVHWSDTAARQALHALGTWNSYFGFGAPRPQIGFSLFEDAWSIIGHVGGSFDLGVKLTLLIPIAILGFIAPYLAVRKLIGDKFISFVTALFYGSTTYFLLRQRSHLQIAFVYALAPLIFVLFTNALRRKDLKSWITFALIYTLGVCSEIRIMYIVTFILAIYAVVFSIRNTEALKKLIKPALITILVLLGLNSFWLLPTLLGGIGSAISDITSRDLFGNNLFDMAHALALSVSSWTGSTPTENFVMQPIPPYLWLIPIIAIVPIAIGTKLSPAKRRLVLFFLIIVLAGFFLTKQVLNPLPQAYPWLYAHFPGFSLFREASKFYLLTAWGYMGLLALGLLALKLSYRPIVSRLTAGIIIAIACINLIPMVTGSIGGLSVSRQISSDYKVLNQYIAKQPDFSRTMWVPVNSQWAYFDATHSMINTATVITQDWKFLVPNQGDSLHQRLLVFFNSPVTKALMDAGGVHTVVVPARDTTNDDDFFDIFGNNRQFYISMLNQVPWLTRKNIGTHDVTVYKSQGDKPYITAATHLLTIPSTDNLQQQYDFNASALNGDFNFAIDDNSSSKHAARLENIFTPDSMTNIQNGTLSTSVTSLSGEPILYVNTNHPLLSYMVNNGIINLFASRYSTIQVNGEYVNGGKNGTQPLGTAHLDATRQYFIEIGNQFSPVDAQKNGTINMGLATGPVRLVSINQSNLVPNPSFENGTWRPAVEDCDPYDSSSAIDMSISKAEHSQGKHSLELDAAMHDACTSSTHIPVVAGQEYFLSFDYKDYKAQSDDEISYQIVFNDAKQTTISKYSGVKNGSWHTMQQSFTVPKGATNLVIRLVTLARTDPTNPMTNFFDNVVLTPLTANLNNNLNTNPQYVKTQLDGNNNTFTYKDSAYSGKNLISNPSLENGLWQKKVSDCNAYDANPELGMKLTSTASNGKTALELDAKRHTACTGPAHIAIKQGATYLLSFDYQSPNATMASYSIGFNDTNNTSITGQINTSNHWQHFSRIIQAPSNARSAQLLVYANASQDGSSYIVDRYDNFKLIEVPDIKDQYYIVDNTASNLQAPRAVTYKSVNTTKKLVNIKGANGPFYLTMSEAYQSKWRLEINNSQTNGILNGWLPGIRPTMIEASNHIKWDDFMNGWYVDPEKICENKTANCTRNADGSLNLNMEIEFSSQRLFYAGTLISVLSFIGCIGYLLIRMPNGWKPPHRGEVWKNRAIQHSRR